MTWDRYLDFSRPFIHSLSVFLLIVVAVGGQTGIAHADEVRCGTRLISPGDSKEAVAQSCGVPTTIRASTIRGPKKAGFQYATQFEIWTYDRGPYEFVRILTFRDGVLERIEEGRYGNPQVDWNRGRQTDARSKGRSPQRTSFQSS